MEKGIIIAIDGFSACGKSTLARALASTLDYLYIDSGAMYRAVTLFFLRAGIAATDETAVKAALGQIQISFETVDGKVVTYLNGERVEEEIRQMRVSRRVSEVATISAVRRALVAQQQALGRKKRCVMDGRDIGTVVFPAAELKIFLTADPQVRARRRLSEMLANGHQITLEAVTENLLSRDQIDSSREDSPLRQAPDAVVIDNTVLSPAEQLAMVAVLARMRGA
ncbi:MAG: (d)CMP kinase [Bacteroidetes bacterium]|nr:MAG: (d)CMP kinase [Bacteroidota bacterium]PTM13642.1 MAG: (d)CMP kinase [Bacteroidota bacterium]